MFYRQIAIDAIEKAIAAANSSGMLEHSGLKGRLREIVIEELIRPFLNPHIKAVTGTIIDAYGHQSNQIDIIIYDEQITPPILFKEGEGVIPCHSVVATIEVKSTLTRIELRKAVKNGRSVKNLKYDYGNISPSYESNIRRYLDFRLVELLPDDREREILKQELNRIGSPACFIFAFDSDLKRKGELSRLKEVVKESNEANPDKPIYVPISGLCVADRSFTKCVRAQIPDPTYNVVQADNNVEEQIKPYRADNDVVLDFISFLTEVCMIHANQRSRIPLNVYFTLTPGVND